jgi:hypothetical protein
LADAWFGCKENILCCLDNNRIGIFQMKRGNMSYRYQGKTYTARQLYVMVERRMKQPLGLFPGMDRSSAYKTVCFMESRFASYYKSSQQSLNFEQLDAAAIAKGILPTDDSSLQWSAPGGGGNGKLSASS